MMERFIHNENLKLWRRRLSETTDERQRDILRQLIENEEAREDEVAKAAGKN
jgi:hypothetical protein